MTIKIAKELELPTDAITQTFAQIGKRGAGKTYLASMIAEQMLDVEAQVIIMDPIGNWWGLRVDVDGKSKGKDIFIIGGSHGDVPLASEGGKEIAKLLVEKSISVVLDISEFRKNERKKFVTDFAEEFFQLKKSNPSAVHIFLEESQKFIPQTVRGDDARMVGAWEDIVRLGRNYGIGCSLITQRPQSVNKEVLSQVECLCVLQVVGRHERKALEEWIREAGEDRSIIDKLPSLHQGEGYVWSPSWLRIFKKVNFNKKKTFDTSATPKLGEATKSAKISKMDIAKLREQMTTVVEKISKDKLDRKGLINEIERLKRDLRISQVAQAKPLIKVDEKGLERAFAQGQKEAEIRFNKEIYSLKANYKQMEKKVIDAGNILGKEIPKLSLEPIKSLNHIKFQPKIELPKVTNSNQEVPISYPSDDHLVTNDDVRLSPAYMRMLKACASFHPSSITKAKISFLSHVPQKASTFRNGLSKLRTIGAIENSGGEMICTDVGNSIAGPVEEIPNDPQRLFSMWSEKISPAYKKMFGVIFSSYPNSVSKEEISDLSDVPMDASTFRNGLSKLRSLGLIKNEGNGLKMSEDFFE